MGGCTIVTFFFFEDTIVTFVHVQCDISVYMYYIIGKEKQLQSIPYLSIVSVKSVERKVTVVSFL